MTRFFREVEKGYSKVLINQILYFTIGWCLGTAVKLIIESFIDSKTK